MKCMKTSLLALLAFMFITHFAKAQTCGFDELYQKAKQDPSTQRQMLDINAAIKTKVQSIRNGTIKRSAVPGTSMDAPGANMVQTANGWAYEVPVVVHVVYDGASNSNNPSDAQIKKMIDDVNGIFGATNSNFASIAEGGVDIPIRFVLAKRDPNCNATNGINRVDGSVLPGYSDYGVKYGSATNGVWDYDIKTLSRWPNKSYYNIWLVNKITPGNIAGYANYPGTESIYDGTVVRTYYATNGGNTLAHELGHAMGLIHTFGEVGMGNDPCVAETDCTTDGDMVCDTEVSKGYPNCTSGAINPCTNAPYAGVQYNIMNYGPCSKLRFTAGQRDRAVAGLLAGRKSLLYSLGGKEPDATPVLKPMEAPQSNLFPDNIGTNAGPTSVEIGNLLFGSSGYNAYGNKDYYLQQFCLSPIGIIPAAGSTLSVTIWGNRQYVKAWIDFNNNGTFESSELVMDTRTPQTTTGVFNYTVSNQVLPNNFSDVVRNTPIRLRVRADRNVIASTTSALAYGQTEDFAIMIESSLPVVFSGLEAKIINSALLVKWNTETERNNDHFEIEVSKDGENFKTINKISTKAKDGNSSSAISYEFTTSSSNLMGANMGWIGAGLGIALLLVAFTRRNKSVRIFSLAIIISLLGIVSCTKTSNDINLSEEGKLWVRIAQVDKDGVKRYSKVITVVKK